jgi:hypothetical protein
MGSQFLVRDNNDLRRQLVALLALAPAIAGCSGASNMFNSDLLSKDTEWFNRPGRLFISNVSIDAAPLTPTRAITPDDLVSAQGACPGMQPPAGPAGANAMAEGPAGSPPAPPTTTGTVALGHTECDVVRGVGAPDSVNISNSPGGDRVAVVTWLRGPRAGIYTFTAGRLSSVERGPEVEAPPATAKSRAKTKRPAAT